MNSEGNINEDLITLLIKCQILSMVNLFMFIYNDNGHCRLSDILLIHCRLSDILLIHCRLSDILLIHCRLSDILLIHCRLSDILLMRNDGIISQGIRYS
jgi:hypothetical protein